MRNQGYHPCYTYLFLLFGWWTFQTKQKWSIHEIQYRNSEQHPFETDVLHERPAHSGAWKAMIKLFSPSIIQFFSLNGLENVSGRYEIQRLNILFRLLETNSRSNTRRAKTWFSWGCIIKKVCYSFNFEWMIVRIRLSIIN